MREAVDWVVRLSLSGGSQADAEAFHRWCNENPANAAAFARAARAHRLLQAASREYVEEQQASSRRGRLPEGYCRITASRRAFLGGAAAATAAATGYMIVEPPLGLWPSFAELRAD